MLKIRDISHHDRENGTLDFAKLKSDGYDGVIIKATEGGGWVDYTLDQNVKEALAHGLHVGFYHYLSFVTDIPSQIKNFTDHIAPYHQDYRPGLDVEHDHKDNETFPADHKARVAQMLSAIPNIMLYSNPSDLGHLDTSFGKWPLWQAEYNSKPRDIAGFERIGWQYQGTPDLNQFNDGVLLIKPAPAKPTAPAFPGTRYFALGQRNGYVTQLGTALVKKGFGKHYKVGPGPSWSEADRLNCRDFQLAQGWTGSGADGYPGVVTWARLFS